MDPDLTSSLARVSRRAEKKPSLGLERLVWGAIPSWCDAEAGRFGFVVSLGLVGMGRGETETEHAHLVVCMFDGCSDWEKQG